MVAVVRKSRKFRILIMTVEFKNEMQRKFRQIKYF